MANETVKRYRGTLAEHDHGESMDILFLDPSDEPLALTIGEDLDVLGRYLTVRYWIAPTPLSDEAMIEGAIWEALGEGDATYLAHYSDITGYLWTDEELHVGGHDLLEELRSQKGHYCLLEIVYATEVPAVSPTRRGLFPSSPPDRRE